MSCFWPHSRKKRRACAVFLMWTSQPCNVPLFLCNNCWSALELNADPITLNTASSLGIQWCSGAALRSIWAGLGARWGWVWGGLCGPGRASVPMMHNNKRITARSRQSGSRGGRGCSLLLFFCPLFSHFIRLLRGSWQSLRAVADP